jgi:quinohemoprotein ethanol dehydrogenase
MAGGRTASVALSTIAQEQSMFKVDKQQDPVLGSLASIAPAQVTQKGSVCLAIAALALCTTLDVQADGLGHPTGKDWPMVGGDRQNTRYSTLSQINTHNVKHLGAAWVSSKFDDDTTTWATPVVQYGLLFITAGSEVYAFNAKTGERVWNYRTAGGAQPKETMESLYRPVPNWKGVGVGQGLVFVPILDGRVIALNAKSGEPVWSHQTGVDEPRKAQWAATAPYYTQGVVFEGMSNGDAFLRGGYTALDAATGKALWTKYTIPAPGEPGHETWPSFNDTWKFGGGGVWVEPAIDTELGIAYFATGNAVPAHAGDWRPGDNLYTCSILAVDMKTGTMKWYYQLVHHDVYEADAGTAVVLYDVKVHGKTRKGLAALRADGYLFQLDRETGKPLFPVEERPVPQLASQKTAPTQPFPVGTESVLMDCEDWKKEKIPAGFVVGCLLTPPASPPPSQDPQNILAPFPLAKSNAVAYSPQTGYFYTHALSTLYWPRRSPDPYFLDFSLTVPGLKSYTQLVAIDSRTGKTAWKKRMQGLPGTTFRTGGAPIVTAGGLLFRRSGDGNVMAHDAKTGEVLWRFQTGMGGSGSGPASPVTYEIDGEQYVALAMGPAVWAFKLGGKLPPGTALSISTTESEFSGPVVDTNVIETTSLLKPGQEPGTRYFIDEFTFSPYRTRVQAGTTVTFINNGLIPHEIAALDGSWGTGPLSPTQLAWVRFEKPGEYTFICKEHPWTYGQIIVESSSSAHARATAATSSADSGNFADRVSRGRGEFNSHCGTCHGEDLLGRAPAPALLGETFMLHWRNATLGDLLDRVRNTMPQGKAGSLDRPTYLDIVSYVLRENDTLSTGREIRDDPQTLNQTIVQLAN